MHPKGGCLGFVNHQQYVIFFEISSSSSYGFQVSGCQIRESSTPTPDGIFRGQRIIAHLQSLSLTERSRLEGWEETLPA